MTGPRVLLIASLLCLAPLAMLPAVGQDATTGERSMEVTPEANTTEYLEFRPGHSETRGHERGDLDVASAVAGGGGEANAQFSVDLLEQRLRTAENATERREAVQQATVRIENRTRQLEEREEGAIREYNDGEIGGSSLVRTLVAVDAEARALDDAAVAVHEHNEDLREPGVTTAEIAALRNRLVPLYGPVREHLREGTDGDDVEPVYVETGGANVTLATVQDDLYVREAHDRSARDVDGEDTLGFDGFQDRVEELYAWTEASSGPGTFGDIGGRPYYHNANVYAAGLAHTHGTGATSDLVTYIDASTTDVFFETQQKYPDRVPTESRETVGDDLRLRLETTRAGGPLGVSVIDVTTDEPVEAAVDVQGEPVGTTGDDRLWTVAPRGDDVTINATYEGSTVTIVESFE